MSSKTNRSGLRRRPAVPFLLILAFAAELALSGCSDSHATAESAEPPATCTYKKGRGLRLTPTAAEFAGLAFADFTGDLPASARLRTIKGDFVYVENDGWLLRTPAEALYEGDRIVVSGVRTLWLAELQAVNGGVGCADGH